MSKKILVTLTLLCALALTLAAQGANPAQAPVQKATPATDTPATGTGNPETALAAGFKLGFIDLERALAETDEGKKEFGELQKFYNDKAAEIKGKQDEVEKLKKQMRDQEKTLNEETKASRQQTITRKERDLERDTEDAQRDFESRRNAAINKIGTKMQPLINGIGKEQNYAAIFVYSQQTPLFAYIDVDKYDITNTIIKRYNAAHPMTAAPASSKAPADDKAPAANKPATPSKPPVPNKKN